MVYFACADIHGHYQAFMKAIKESGYVAATPNHQLIVCGDMFGRAAQCKSDIINIYRYLTSFEHFNTPIVLRGNHEGILIDIFKRGYCTELDCRNGEDKTIAALADCMPFETRTPGPVNNAGKNYPNFYEWLCNLPFYHETKNYVFVHGWIPRAADMQGFREANEDEWYDATWSHTEHQITHMPKNGYEKNLVFGHWGTYRLRKYSCWADDHSNFYDKQRKLIGLDNTTVFSHKMQIEIIYDEPIY
jgi:hypothetical protein